MSVNKFICALLSVLGFLLISPTAHAQLWGSGAYQGGMVCPYETKTSKAASHYADEENEIKRNINQVNADLRTSRRVDNLSDLERKRKRIRDSLEKYFNTGITEILLDDHIESRRDPRDYKIGACLVDAAQCTSSQVIEVPDEDLAKVWEKYVGAKGSIKTSICSDPTLRSNERSSGLRTTLSQCEKGITEYRALTMRLDKARDTQSDLTAQLEELNAGRAEVRAREREERQTEAYCEDCEREGRGYEYEQPERDWVSTIANVGLGVYMIGQGNKVRREATQQYALAGQISSQDYGYPYTQAGIAGVINGLAGPGAYGCTGGYAGAGYVNGSGVPGSIFNSPNGMYGPGGAVSGAFGYPQNMYGAPYAGGAFNPGFTINGGINLPNGAVCIQAPCNVGNQFPYSQNPFMQQGQFPGAQIGVQFGQQNPFMQGQNPFMQGQNPFMQGQNPFMQGQNPFSLPGGQLSAQYQLQVLQQQQQMQMQQYQQQQQYYQMQMQMQMQQQQQAYQRQQQAYQIQMQMAQLNMQLQQIQSQSYYGNTGSLFNSGYNGGISAGITIGNPGYSTYVGPSGYSPYGNSGYNPYQNTGVVNPGGTYNPGVINNGGSGR